MPCPYVGLSVRVSVTFRFHTVARRRIAVFPQNCAGMWDVV